MSAPPTVAVPPEVAVRLRALQRLAEELPLALLALRLDAQRAVVLGRTVDVAALDRALVVAAALRAELERPSARRGGGR